MAYHAPFLATVNHAIAVPYEIESCTRSEFDKTERRLRLHGEFAKARVQQYGTANFIGIRHPRLDQVQNVGAMSSDEILKHGKCVFRYGVRVAANGGVKALQGMIGTAQKQKMDCSEKNIGMWLTLSRMRGKASEIVVSCDARCQP